LTLTYESVESVESLVEMDRVQVSCVETKIQLRRQTEAKDISCDREDISGDTADCGDLVRAVVNCRMCELAIALTLLVRARGSIVNEALC
jgi:hypothetical protein